MPPHEEQIAPVPAGHATALTEDRAGLAVASRSLAACYSADPITAGNPRTSNLGEPRSDPHLDRVAKMAEVDVTAYLVIPVVVLREGARGAELDAQQIND